MDYNYFVESIYGEKLKVRILTLEEVLAKGYKIDDDGYCHKRESTRDIYIDGFETREAAQNYIDSLILQANQDGAEMPCLFYLDENF